MDFPEQMLSLLMKSPDSNKHALKWFMNGSHTKLVIKNLEKKAPKNLKTDVFQNFCGEWTSSLSGKSPSHIPAVIAPQPACEPGTRGPLCSVPLAPAYRATSRVVGCESLQYLPSDPGAAGGTESWSNRIMKVGNDF